MEKIDSPGLHAKTATDGRAVRHELHIPLRYRLEGGQEWRPGEAINMSESGLLFSSNEMLEVDARIQITFQGRISLCCIPAPVWSGLFVVTSATGRKPVSFLAPNSAECADSRFLLPSSGLGGACTKFRLFPAGQVSSKLLRQSGCLRVS